MYELFIVISEMKVATDAAFWRKGKMKEFLLIPIYPAMLSDACIRQTMIPVRKSATAKPMIKKVVGVRKVLKGSFQIVTNKSPFPMAAARDTKARKMPEAICTSR